MAVRPAAPPDGAAVARLGLALTAAVVAAEVCGQLVDFWALGLRVPALDSSTEASIFVRIGTGGIVACALLTLALGRRSALLGLATSFLAVDAVADLHERLPHWQLLYLPLLGAVLVGFWRLSARRLARAGLLALVLSLAIHLLGPHLLAALGLGPADWEYQLKIALKEGTEVGGWLLLATALAADYAAKR